MKRSLRFPWVWRGMWACPAMLCAIVLVLGVVLGGCSPDSGGRDVAGPAPAEASQESEPLGPGGALKLPPQSVVDRAALVAAAQAAAAPEHAFVLSAGGAVAENPGQRFRARVEGGALTLSRAGEASLLGLRLARVGRGAASAPVAAAGAVEASGNRVELRRGTEIVEWYVNGPFGLEQGFGLASPPALTPPSPGAGIAERDAPLALTIELSGALLATLAPDGLAVELRDERGRAALRYADLVVRDATGKVLPSALEVTAGSAIRLLCDDRAAAYPITIDPLIAVAEAKLFPTHPDRAHEQLGQGAAISGDVAVLGAPEADDLGESAGAAYVFVRSAGTWAFAQKLFASDGKAKDSFGEAIALEGDLLVVGAPRSVNEAGPGAAYLFAKIGNAWVEQAKLEPGATNDYGASVAISGQTVLVGCPYCKQPNIISPGAVYVYVLAAGVWTEQAVIVPADVSHADHFGSGVAISGDTALLGAPGVQNKGAAYVFERSGETWTQQTKLMASDAPAFSSYGEAVALSGSVGAVGSADSAATGVYILGNDGSGWAEKSKIADPAGALYFARHLALDGTRLAVSENDGAYVYSGAGGVWSLEAQITGLDPYGYANPIAVSGSTVLVGVSDSADGTFAGAGHVFVESAGQWPEQAKLGHPGDLNDDAFGARVALDGEVAVVLAADDMDVGSAYILRRNGAQWIEEDFLVSSFCASGIALDGDTVVLDDGKCSSYAHVYVHVNDDWFLEDAIAVDGAPGNRLDLSGDRIVTSGKNGVARVWERAGGNWTKTAEVTSSDGAEPQGPYPVALDKDTFVLGVPARSGKAGAAYVFVLGAGGWTEQAKLALKDPLAEDAFGAAVALEGDTLVVGAPGRSAGAAESGAAYVFERTAGIWSQSAEIAGAPGAGLGRAVDLSGDTLAAVREDGQAVVYLKLEAGWSEQWAPDYAGIRDVALSGLTVLLGAPEDDEVGSKAGAAWIVDLAKSPGLPCGSATECASGHCVDGVCCDAACGGGKALDCQACSVAAGAKTDGTCASVVDDMSCDDGDACTQADVCQSGACTGTDPVVCAEADACSDAGTCNAKTGTCAATAKPDGTVCEGGACQSGTCVPTASTGSSSGFRR